MKFWSAVKKVGFVAVVSMYASAFAATVSEVFSVSENFATLNEGHGEVM